ncbi:P-loop containing nucleoside triphosphate hydrolase protein [Piedraia hortae CBS 480.64]|uniref:P-loop containing nucleoside triphosphate hydrolase protein n=1 Tax=Piedraia hortae CBS 480.64 TaxID=1314780 RepID=A0A6A7BYJ2_9PEZI|nr:P-loop containing nucleoside triphosphate hydrolase protein [Piedraia hortae CBS 480.64]
MTTSSLEAKLVVLGAQGVGKTSLVHRYLTNSFLPEDKAQTTLGASFVTTRVLDAESGVTVRLQIWDTAGQERFRSISRLYYRGAHAAILCYDVTKQKTFEEMGVCLQELREACDHNLIVHVVGTKTDVVAAEPDKREVTFERCITYVAEQLYPDISLNKSADRESGLWGQGFIWDCCHEVSAKDGEGIDEVYRVITRKLVEQQSRHLREEEASRAQTPGEMPPGSTGYFDLPHGGSGSFRLSYRDRRRSWLSFPSAQSGWPNEQGAATDGDETRSRCC